MKYIIMNFSSLDGYFKGSFKAVWNLYLCPKNGREAQWTKHMCEAVSFDSEEEARHYAREIFGMRFADNTMGVISVTPAVLENSARTRDIILERTKDE